MDEALRARIEHRKSILAAIKQELVERLQLEFDPAILDDDTFLFGSGLALDSIDAMELIIGLQARFGVELPEGDLATLIRREDGGVACETYVANLGDGYLLLTEGASPAEIAGLLANEARDVPGTEVVDTTRETALFSVDGPYAWELIKDLVGMGILGA